MRVTRRVLAMALIAVLGLAGSALAGGFSIYEAGARATALGGAFTATADDGSALFYNPAGMSFLEGPMVDVNLMPILPGSKFSGAEPYNFDGANETVDQTFLIPGLYYTRPFNETITYGIGLYAPFGLGVHWDNETSWVGRYSSYNVDLATIYVTPAVSYQVNEQLAVSVGADVAHQAITLNKFSFESFGASPGNRIDTVDAEISGSSNFNFTPCAGLMYRPNEKLSVGVMYHAEKTMKYEDGDATLKNIATPALAPIVDATLTAAGGTAGADGYAFKADTELTLPSIMSLGLSYRLTEKLRAEFNAVYWTWSAFEEIVLDFQQTDTQELAKNLDLEIYEGYEDAWQWRAGIEYQAAPEWTLMAGYVRDATPQPVESMGPLLADGDRNDFSFGFQHHRDRWTFTGSYMAVLFDERATVVDGELTYNENAADPVADQAEQADREYEAGAYKSIANIFGFSVGYHF